MPEVDILINYWKSTLFHHRFIMDPSAIYLVEETIRQLEYLKSLDPDGRFGDLKP